MNKIKEIEVFQKIFFILFKKYIIVFVMRKITKRSFHFSASNFFKQLVLNKIK